MNAEKFSTFPWPYWCSASAGLSETLTDSRVINAAIKSRPEWAASERMPRLRVESPTISLRKVIAIADSSEFIATVRFSERMLSSIGFTCKVDTTHSSNDQLEAENSLCVSISVSESHHPQEVPPMFRSFLVFVWVLTALCAAQTSTQQSAPQPTPPPSSS